MYFVRMALKNVNFWGTKHIFVDWQRQYMSYDWHTENMFCITDTENEGVFNMVPIGNIFFYWH